MLSQLVSNKAKQWMAIERKRFLLLFSVSALRSQIASQTLVWNLWLDHHQQESFSLCSLAKPFGSRKTYKLTIYLAGCYVYTGSQYAVVKRRKKKEYSSGREGREQKDFIRGLEKFSLIGVLGFAQSRVMDITQSH